MFLCKQKELKETSLNSEQRNIIITFLLIVRVSGVVYLTVNVKWSFLHWYMAWTFKASQQINFAQSSLVSVRFFWLNFNFWFQSMKLGFCVQFGSSIFVIQNKETLYYQLRIQYAHNFYSMYVKENFGN